jgi:lipid-A-disaccharide synthase
MGGVFGEALALIKRRVGALEVVVPAVPRLAEIMRATVASWPVPGRIVTDPAEKDADFRTARAALTKSGTSTLELALAGVPMVAAYKVPPVEAVVARILITAPSAILTNLILGENVVPEFLQQDCTAERLAEALIPLMADTPERRRQTNAFARLDAIMDIGRAVPSERAAAAVLGSGGAFNQAGRPAMASPGSRA